MLGGMLGMQCPSQQSGGCPCRSRYGAVLVRVRGHADPAVGGELPVPVPVLGGGCWGRYRGGGGGGDAGVGIGGNAVVGLRSPVPQVQEIVFRNFYTAFLSVRVQRPGPGGSRRWMTCLRDLCLMPCPHTEEGSQDYFCLRRHQVRAHGITPPSGAHPTLPTPQDGSCSRGLVPLSH